MPWSLPRTWIAGEIIGSSLFNTGVRDNLIALRLGGIATASQAQGDIFWALSSMQLGRVGGAATGAVIISGGTSGAPAWSRVPPVDGVKFRGTQVASADVNTLDDYEEGSWTPVIGGIGGTSGQTYGVQVGRYRKLGKTVWVTGYALLTAKGTITSTVQIHGLPYPAANITDLITPGAVFYGALSTTWMQIVAHPAPASSSINLSGSTGAAVSNGSGLATADISNTTFMSVSLEYQTDN